ncbi:MAG: metalloregulator ArsR/SmtB family transcription factor [Gammaproteobacteria bacterium]|nr:metalloregulator ArsR/SmtB family transcription factor [Gammaproteobacteria bacterium]
MFATEPSSKRVVEQPEALCLEHLAALCKASGDPLRLQVLRVLRHDSLGVLELCSIFDMRQPAMSHHLKVLASAGLVTSRREGNTIFYRRAPLSQHRALTALQNSLFLAVDQLLLPAPVVQRLALLHAQRAQSSQQFFQQNADKFRAQQDLIASYDKYADTVAQLQRDAPLSQRHLALEVGPGDGAFLRELAPAFERVIALDNSAEMLETARHLAQQQSLLNVDFILGDTRHPELQGLQADCIVVNMVLHHTPSPAAIFSDLAAVLAPAGVLLVTDLCNHDQAWVRENCGDLWLGFEPGDLQLWAQSAGLREIASEYLAQRNGFQIQVRLFGHRQYH